MLEDEIHEYCLNNLKTKARDYFICCLLYTSNAYITALLSFHADISGIFYNTKHDFSLFKITWWKKQICMIYENPGDAVKGTTLITLKYVISKTNLPQSLLSDYIEGYERFFYKKSISTLFELESLLTDIYVPLFKMLLFVSGIRNNFHEVIVNAAIARGITVSLMNEKMSEKTENKMALHYMPSEVLNAFCTHPNIISPQLKQEAIKFVADRGISHVDMVSRNFKTLPRNYDFIFAITYFSLIDLKRIKLNKDLKHHHKIFHNIKLYMKLTVANLMRNKTEKV